MVKASVLCWKSLKFKSKVSHELSRGLAVGQGTLSSLPLHSVGRIILATSPCCAAG